ncbi:MAG: hypothetical protein DMF63_09460 [Acidobacteria bacterium]|nr:MAG: hypothetical protein DMF63_09460 [Acidobacteriota bacterium]
MERSWSPTNVFGLYELSSDGTILYTRPRTDDGLREPQQGIVGRDFFRDIGGCENIEDLRHHFRRFITGDQPVDIFTFDCILEREIVRAKVFMTRAYEHDYDHAGGIVIMDIRQAA